MVLGGLCRPAGRHRRSDGRKRPDRVELRTQRSKEASKYIHHPLLFSMFSFPRYSKRLLKAATQCTWQKLQNKFYVIGGELLTLTLNDEYGRRW